MARQTSVTWPSGEGRSPPKPEAGGEVRACVGSCLQPGEARRASSVGDQELAQAAGAADDAVDRERVQDLVGDHGTDDGRRIDAGAILLDAWGEAILQAGRRQALAQGPRARAGSTSTGR